MAFAMFKKHLKRMVLGCVITLGLGSLVLVVQTLRAMQPLPENLHALTTKDARPKVYSREGVALSFTYQNHWNAHDQHSLHTIPELMQAAMLLAEDKRFYQHRGMDWQARLHALAQNILALEGLRGASTISEQVVRMIHQRPRTVWSRWLEGWEAAALERQFDKATILEFYLNQVPYAAQRRGVGQAARYYFDRDLSTLSEKEIFTLAVLVRAPSRFDLYRNPNRIDGRLATLLDRAEAQRLIKSSIDVQAQTLQVQRPQAPIQARHFVRYASALNEARDRAHVYTTLDASVQRAANELLNARLASLTDRNVHNAGLLVVDHQLNEVLAWAVGQNGAQRDIDFDTVLTKRQPGSTLKPFVYAAALEKGWTAATLIDDSPLVEAVGRGAHAYRNYSNRFYGEVSLRDALGNSLNIPAVKAAKFVGLNPLLKRLHRLGLTELDLRSIDYGNGIALGNGEISLLSMSQAYASLARHGERVAFNVLKNGARSRSPERVFSPEVSSLIANILSDPNARALEFGQGGVLNLPVQTAVKTGTSTDYRDAWVFGFNHRYLVGVWMGNLDNQPMDNITGSTGPALVMRSMFAELNKRERNRPLYLSPKLVRKDICAERDSCTNHYEYFFTGHTQRAAQSEAPRSITMQAANSITRSYRIEQPINQSQLAYDPRIPLHLQQLKFALNTSEGVEKVEWLINGASNGDTPYWTIERGDHQLVARVYSARHSERPLELSATFSVK